MNGNVENPCYVIQENKLRSNLQLISDISKRAGVEIILALKAFANWKIFPVIREYVNHTTASSLNEARLSAEFFGGLTYTYSPAYEKETFADILRYSEHLTFNSLTQLERFLPEVKRYEASDGGHRVSVGLRVNPEYSEIATELYNPCAPDSRFGVTADKLGSNLPEGVEGLHFHCLCENNADTLGRVMEHVEEKFGHLLDKVKWLNMGGGHLFTREGYDVDLFVSIINKIHTRHPKLQIILEPGSAFLWQTGFLRSRVVDIVANNGIPTAILNVSFTCHMPDCLEMPYWPQIRGAKFLDEATAKLLCRDNSVADLHNPAADLQNSVTDLHNSMLGQHKSIAGLSNSVTERPNPINTLPNLAADLPNVPNDGDFLGSDAVNSINVPVNTSNTAGNASKDAANVSGIAVNASDVAEKKLATDNVVVGDAQLNSDVRDNKFIYRMGGNSCLSGDQMGCWQFDSALHVGDEIVFEDMIHYTTVKTNMFNGVQHPSLSLLHVNGVEETLRKFDFSDYSSRMD